MEEITADSLEQKQLCCELQNNWGDTKEENTKLKQVIEKFYQIRRADSHERDCFSISVDFWRNTNPPHIHLSS